MKYITWLWPAIIAASGLATIPVVFFELYQPVRIILILWFLLLCPGMAFVKLFELKDLLQELVLALALSLAIETALGLVMVYSHTWSIELILIILIGLSLAGVLLQILRLIHQNKGLNAIT